MWGKVKTMFNTKKISEINTISRLAAPSHSVATLWRQEPFPIFECLKTAVVRRLRCPADSLDC